MNPSGIQKSHPPEHNLAIVYKSHSQQSDVHEQNSWWLRSLIPLDACTVTRSDSLRSLGCLHHPPLQCPTTEKNTATIPYDDAERSRSTVVTTVVVVGHRTPERGNRARSSRLENNLSDPPSCMDPSSDLHQISFCFRGLRLQYVYLIFKPNIDCRIPSCQRPLTVNACGEKALESSVQDAQRDAS